MIIRLLAENKEQTMLRHKSNEDRLDELRPRIENILGRMNSYDDTSGKMMVDLYTIQSRFEDFVKTSQDRTLELTLRLDRLSDSMSGNVVAISRLTAETIAAEKTVVAMYKAQDDAIAKAEAANKDRFESVNEFRGQLSDQTRTFMPRAEVEVLFKSMDAQITSLQNQVMAGVGQKMGTREGWTAAVGVIAFIATVLGIIALIRGV